LITFLRIIKQEPARLIHFELARITITLEFDFFIFPL
jgi:hypothetical protein